MAGIYREAMMTRHGWRCHITMMAHTFVGKDDQAIQEIAEPAMTRYLDVNLEMQKAHSVGMAAERGFDQLSTSESRFIIKSQVNNDLRGPLSFVGTLEHCALRAEYLSSIGVDEIACLIDFGIGFDDVMASLGRLAILIQSSGSK